MVDESIAALQQVIDAPDKKFRSRPDAYYRLGKHYASLKQHDQAVQVFEKMLAEGAALYEDEVLHLCGSYYAILGKRDEAAAKLNILKRKADSPLAQEAAYKLAVLWINAGTTDAAVDAVQDLAQRFPTDKRIADLLLRVADLFRGQRRYDQTIAVCEQIQARYPKSGEALAGRYLVGLCYRDRQEFEKAVEVLGSVGQAADMGARTIAAEATLQAADISYRHLNNMTQAIQQYEEAAKLARESESDRRSEILEQCYFRLAEYHFQQKNWAVALENYLLLRQTGSQLNVLGRILACQTELGAGNNQVTLTEADLTLLEQKIASQPGTAAAAEAELFLMDRKLADAVRRGEGLGEMAEQYRGLLQKYSRQVLAADHMESYIHAQVGNALAHGKSENEWRQAVAALQQAVQVDPSDENPYKIPALENLALVAERAGDPPTALKAYQQLLDSARQKLAANSSDPELEKQTLGYLKGLVTRSQSADLIESSLETCRQIIAERGQLSELSREARFSLGELHYIRRDFSAAVKAFQEFIRIYGPPQDAEGNLTEAPWKPENVDERVGQVCEAAIRIAHCWYLQSHQQNMLRAYRWIARNLPSENPHLAETHYWLAMEFATGTAADTPEGKRKLADALWTTVANPVLDYHSKEFDKSFHSWVRPGDARYAPARSTCGPPCSSRPCFTAS